MSSDEEGEGKAWGSGAGGWARQRVGKVHVGWMLRTDLVCRMSYVVG